VSGYLLKDSDPQRLIRAIREVAAGGHMVDPRLVRTTPPGASALLTPRETEILRLAAEGYRTSDIALMLALSAGTVRNYLATVVSKLNARNRVDAIRIARAEGWLNWGTP
jgi:two-component system response regulator DesR